MQFSQILAVFALAVATTSATAIPHTASFDDTFAKIKLAHPDITDEDANAATLGFLQSVTQLTSVSTRDIEKRGCCKNCGKGPGACALATFTFGMCCL